MKKSTAGQVAYYGIFVALAFVFSFVEVLIPISLGIPGIKLGLANIVVLTALYALGPKEAFFISCVRIVLVGFTFGNMASLLYSLAGGLLSWLVMCLLKKIKGFSMIGVSLAGGISHNIGQIFVAALMLKTTSVIYYLPVLLIAGTITGILIGILGGMLLKVQLRLKDSMRY
ncbi:heptaprenyl diphosphate synthase [Anaerocolumna jejuensis DSM 15929]|jgi:heptaprenyl diphosphate synthase|uniref:Heptaprenyl diphosphate synthase n=1 Tax=Anaerocolumna jejuensis DSM 15929 TaxID=1121322 RepID=A0A1M7AY98_9FIRM|nr:Gx transporter family protein [Anaerocolumna jejuensis]SHL47576.1 heptaprenyl diphosphate synthase [Anaerocolumna jejuensis DSM 15929]